jgi:hypothetical protein
MGVRKVLASLRKWGPPLLVQHTTPSYPTLSVRQLKPHSVLLSFGLLKDIPGPLTHTTPF